MKNETSSSVRLQAPGAGLPLPQRLILRFWMGPRVSKRTPLAESRKRYELLTEKIVQLAQSTPPALRSKPILVNPIRGLEDSSRFWSLNGTLEHLLIVSRAAEAVILSLSAGVVPSGEADTAKVKPKNPNQDWLAEFIHYAPGLMARLDDRLSQSGLNIHSDTQFKHPWFGPFTARQWYWLLGSHQGIHYQQAKQIAQGLSRSIPGTR